MEKPTKGKPGSLSHLKHIGLHPKFPEGPEAQNRISFSLGDGKALWACFDDPIPMPLVETS
jgi:hypothetical protein